MPNYEFQMPDGLVVTQFFRMKDVPDVGSMIDIGGVECMRIASALNTTDVWRPYISHRLPRNLPGCACTPEGLPIVRTQAQENSIKSQLGWERQ